MPSVYPARPAIAMFAACLLCFGCGRSAATASVESDTTLAPAESSSSSSETAPVTTPNPVTYVVQPGDSLSVVAERFGVTTKALADFNAVSDVNAVVVGQELRIPPVAPKETEAADNETDDSPDSATTDSNS